MARAAWVAALAVALVAVGFAVAEDDGTFTASGEEAEDPVLAAPHDGDRATYEHVRSGYEDARTPEPYRLQWGLEEARLPDGSNPALPSLTYGFLEQAESGSSDTDSGTSGASHLPAPGVVATVDRLTDPPTPPGAAEASSTSDWTVLENRYTRHATELPGSPVAASFHSVTKTVYEDEDGTETRESTFDRTSIVDERHPCPGSVAMRLAGETADAAHAKLESCTQQRLEELDRDDEYEVTVEVESGWTDDETWDRVWTAHVNTTLTGPDADLERSRTLVTTPSASLPLADVTATTGTEEGRLVDREAGTRLTGFETGGDRLEDADPLGEMPTVETVAWSADGPASGDVDEAPFEEAHAAVERTKEGREFFQAAEDPRVASATLTDGERQLDVEGPMRSANGDECESDHAVELPEPAGERSWLVSWSSENEGELFGVTQEPRALRDQGVTEAQPPTPYAQAFRSEAEETWPPFGDVPPLRGPSLDDLWSHRDMVTPFQAEGTDKIELVSWGQDDAAAMSGSVGRAECTSELGADTWTLVETEIAFESGTATSVSTIQLTEES